MIQLAAQPISKNYIAHALNRSFFVSYFCYILTIIIPVTILINIQYSWPQYKRQLLKPMLTYRGYQLTCYDSQGNIYYNSNLEGGFENKNYQINANVGVYNDKININGQVFIANIKACSAQIYFIALIDSSAQVLVHLPINIAVSNPAYNIQLLTLKGTIAVKNSGALGQSLANAINQTQFGTYPYSFTGNFRDSGAKTFILDSNIIYSKPDLTTNSTTSLQFNAQYTILKQLMYVEASLIDKLRSFIPIFMYLCLFIWWVVVNPLVEWMLQNKVYNAKLVKQKIKKQ